MNWGKSIVLAFVLFIGFIMYFVIKISTDKGKNHQLVTEKYYNKELTYQDRIKASENAKILGVDIKIKKVKEGLQVILPNQLVLEKASANLLFYRPSNELLDFEISIPTIKDSLIISKEKLLQGRWNVSVDVKSGKKSYLYTKEIVY